MKCPKCGSEFIETENYIFCPAVEVFGFPDELLYECPYCCYIFNSKVRKADTKQPDPTTAEMWEWLGRNFSVTFLHRDGENDYLEIAHGFWNHISEENGFDACVRAAYAEARKEVKE